MNTVSIRMIDKMREVLIDPKAKSPKEFYYMLRGKPNITIWNPGTTYCNRTPHCRESKNTNRGEEFIKTYGHYHLHNEEEWYEILYGKALAILQKRKMEKGKWIDDEIEKVKIIKASKGQKINIPQGWGHTIYNIGKTFLITIDNSPSDAEHSQNDYLSIQKMHGFCYYLIEEKSKIKLIKNSRYRNIPNVESVLK